MGIKCGRAEMFHVIQPCRRLLPSVFTRTVSPALTCLEPISARHSPISRRGFASLHFSPCPRHCRANSSQSVKTRWYSEQSDAKDGDAAAVKVETTDIDRRKERQGSAALVEASSMSHAATVSLLLGFHSVFVSATT